MEGREAFGCGFSKTYTIELIQSPSNKTRFSSHYPESRTKTLSEGDVQGVVGSLEMLNATTLSTQPIHAFDWSPDRLGLAVCGAFDQTVRVLVTTNLNLH